MRLVATLALVGASVAMMFQMFGPWLDSFVLSNALSPRGRRTLLLWVVMGGLLGLVAAAVLYLPRRRSNGVDRLERSAHLSAPFVLARRAAAVLQPRRLGRRLSLHTQLDGADSDRRTAHAPSARRLARGRRAAWAAPGARSGLAPRGACSRGRPPLGAVRLGRSAAVGYAVYVAYFAIRNHRHFNTFDYDLGQLNNEFYNALHGHPFRCTALIREGNWSELRNHASFTIYPLLPFYALAPRSEALLAIQAALVGSAAIPLYRFSARRLPRSTALALTFAYLLYSPLQKAVFFEFHFEPIAAAFLIWMIDMFDDGRTAAFVVFFTSPSDAARTSRSASAALGLFLMLVGHRTRAGLWIFLIAVVYFIAVRFVLMPLIGSWGFADFYKDLFPPGEQTFGGIVKTMLSNPIYTFRTMLSPEKLHYLLHILLPIAFLPLRRVSLWLAVLPGAVITVLTTGVWRRHQHRLPILRRISSPTSSRRRRCARPGCGDGRRPRGAPAGAPPSRLSWRSLVIETARWGGIPATREFLRPATGPSISSRTRPEEAAKRPLAPRARRPRPAAGQAGGQRSRAPPRLDPPRLLHPRWRGTRAQSYILYVPNSGIGRDGDQAGRALSSGEFVEIDRRPQLSLLKRRGAP